MDEKLLNETYMGRNERVKNENRPVLIIICKGGQCLKAIIRKF